MTNTHILPQFGHLQRLKGMGEGDKVKGLPPVLPPSQSKYGERKGFVGGVKVRYPNWREVDMVR
jgi:hypothetical protein